MLNISLPDNVEAVITQQAEQAGFDTATDYLVHLVLREQERLSQKAKIEAPLVEGLESGRPIEATDQWRAQKQSMFLWQQVSSTEIAQRLRERAATYTGSASEGLPDAAFDRETICKPSQNRGDISK
ncbi:hypothetical protein [Nodosilinea sp. P-1105]|uniref:ribbon-helix-helix domain-containing protein n=1 Tax=Nodosilinea sp. P-1105 TaxID=2546229 RepID=UPI001980067A|nr:hypothetical protein [Nodosilinea sp. P-1105]